jgi:hypothetical protein
VLTWTSVLSVPVSTTAVGGLVATRLSTVDRRSGRGAGAAVLMWAVAMVGGADVDLEWNPIRLMSVS